jgi:hypothetical protein
MAKERNETIDVLRGVSLLAVIFIHCLAYYLSDNVAHTLWNYSQFAVQVFVFCSGYLFFKKFIGTNTQPSFNYLFSRIKRLLVPYYIFLVTFIPIIYLTQRKKITFTFLLENILVKDGIDINWLVLLFIQFAALIHHLENNNVPAEGVKVSGQDKRSRLALITHLIKLGKVKFPEKGAEELIMQLTGFGIEKHDDLADAFSLLLLKILENDKSGFEFFFFEIPGGFYNRGLSSVWDDDDPLTMDRKF